MPRRLIECVANFSEGRREFVLAHIGAAIINVAGVALLDRHADSDHNRSVFTFAGEPDRVAEAAVESAGAAVRHIDLTQQSGVHPRIGAADVIPLVPVEGVTLAECAELAAAVGERIWARFGVPVYLYEAAARRADRCRLEHIRRGGFEGLRDLVRTDPMRAPDIGDAELHPTAGAAVVGARKFLIAYNINLATPETPIAKEIARRIRASAGGMPHVKALGVALESRGQSQVTMNLTDFEVTPIHTVLDAVRRHAAGFGVGIAGTEIIGLVPRAALDNLVPGLDFDPGAILENRLESLAARLSRPVL